MEVFWLVAGGAVVLVVGWRLLLIALKGASRAVATGIAEGREERVGIASSNSVDVMDEEVDVSEELLMVTYKLGESELLRDPQAYGYELQDNVFSPEMMAADGTISMAALGSVIKTLSPMNPAREALERVKEDHARKVSAAMATDLAEAHRQTRTLEIMRAGAAARQK